MLAMLAWECSDVLMIIMQGDTAVNIFTLVNNQKLERPMVHDVMYSVGGHVFYGP
jgi:bifunctional DNase/RNase